MNISITEIFRIVLTVIVISAISFCIGFYLSKFSWFLVSLYGLLLEKLEKKFFRREMENLREWLSRIFLNKKE